MTPPPLSVRLAAATAGSRELDGELWRLLNGWPESDGAVMEGVWYRRDPNDAVAFEAPPAFTQSLDAITAEIERRLPDWEWSLRRRPHGGWQVCIGRNWESGTDTFLAPTGPLCLCLALLRAIGSEG